MTCLKTMLLYLAFSLFPLVQSKVADVNFGDDLGSKDAAQHMHSMLKRAAGTSGSKWPNGVIPYEIDADSFSYEAVETILSALHEWERNTCVTFQLAYQGDRIIFKNSGISCSSYLGKRGGPQEMAVGSGCRTKPILLHIIGHAIGLFDEQQRPDRDNYIRINWTNAIPSGRHTLSKRRQDEVMRTNIPYDYHSIMHYGKNAFSKDGRSIVIQTLDPAFQDIIGNAQTLSFGDIKTVNLMYSCKPPGCRLTDAQCPGQGFVGEDCMCLCPSQDSDRKIRLCGGSVV